MSRPALSSIAALALALASSVCARPAIARAQIDHVGALRAAESTRAELARESVELDCHAAGDASSDTLECALHVTWELRDPRPPGEGDDALTARVQLTWTRDEEAQLTIGGAPIAELPTLRPANVLVPGTGTIAVELRATIRLERELVPGSGVRSPLQPIDPLHARHPLIAEPWDRARRGLTWLRPDDLRFASVGPTEVRVRAPEGWHVGGDLRPDGTFAPAERAEGSAPPAQRISIELSRGSRGQFFRNGGPFLALGGTFDAGFRGRVGYEIGLDEFVLVSVALDSDFERQAILTPQVELASWGMVIVPSLAVGLGVPIRLTDAPLLPRTAGIRIESSATFFAAAFVATLDVFPIDGSYQLSLLGRIGL